MPRPNDFRRACLLYRLLVDIRPASVAIEGCDDRIAQIAALAIGQSLIMDSSPHFSIIGPRASVVAAPLPDTLLFLDSRSPLVDDCISALGCGHIFSGPLTTLVINNPALTRQTFYPDI